VFPWVVPPGIGGCEGEAVGPGSMLSSPSNAALSVSVSEATGPVAGPVTGGGGDDSVERSIQSDRCGQYQSSM
jgi:hypothetical protein